MDDKGFRAGVIINVVVAVISQLINAASLALAARDIAPSIDWLLIAVVAEIIFFVTIVVYIWRLQRILTSKSPSIQLVRAYTHEGKAWSKKPYAISPKGDTTIDYPAYYVHAEFANSPKYGTELNHANGVRAKLTFYDAEGRVLIEPIDGRWASSDEPKHPREIPSLVRVQIKSDGKPESLGFVFKPVGEAHWYVFSNDNYFFPNLRDDSLELTEQIVDVHIELTGERVHKDFWLHLYNEGKDGGIRVEKHRLWHKRRIKRKLKRVARGEK
jgi:hypothetical protein